MQAQPFGPGPYRWTEASREAWSLVPDTALRKSFQGSKPRKPKVHILSRVVQHFAASIERAA